MPQHPPIFVYHYDPTEHFFLSKRRAGLDPVSGQALVPANATLVAPPNQYEQGKIPVFTNGAWELRDDIFWRPTYDEINYDAGRPSSSWAPKTISILDFPSYPNLDRLAASGLVVIRFVDAIRYVDQQFEGLIGIHNEISNGAASIIHVPPGSQRNLSAQPTPINQYKFGCEGLVFQIRHCLDTLCRLTELLVSGDRVNSDKMFRCDKIGALFGAQKNSVVANVMIGKQQKYLSDETEFLSITNNLFNAMKHTHMNAEANSLIGETWPTITTFSAPHGRHRELITYRNHNAFHITMGFHDAIDRILENQRRFLAG